MRRWPAEEERHAGEPQIVGKLCGSHRRFREPEVVAVHEQQMALLPVAASSPHFVAYASLSSGVTDFRTKCLLGSGSRCSLHSARQLDFPATWVSGMVTRARP